MDLLKIAEQQHEWDLTMKLESKLKRIKINLTEQQNSLKANTFDSRCDFKKVRHHKKQTLVPWHLQSLGTLIWDWMESKACTVFLKNVNGNMKRSRELSPAPLQWWRDAQQLYKCHFFVIGTEVSICFLGQHPHTIPPPGYLSLSLATVADMDINHHGEHDEINSIH